MLIQIWYFQNGRIETVHKFLQTFSFMLLEEKQAVSVARHLLARSKM